MALGGERLLRLINRHARDLGQGEGRGHARRLGLGRSSVQRMARARLRPGLLSESGSIIPRVAERGDMSEGTRIPFVTTLRAVHPALPVQ